jgi:DNA transposition AAA+ family ATPase
MKKQFVKTENDRRFRSALQQKLTRGANESGMVVVPGRAGDGKTRTLHNWASACNAVMVTAYPGWTPRRMLVDIAERLAIPTRGAWEAAVETRISEEEIPLVVDEAGFALADNAACIERLRSITDKSGTLLVMVIMERDMARLRQFDQITSRATLCPFTASTMADVKAACAQLAEVEIADDLAERIHRESGARMRLVIEAINAAEQAARLAGKTSVGAADLKGCSLCEDFNHTPRSPRTGRGAA